MPIRLDPAVSQRQTRQLVRQLILGLDILESLPRPESDTTSLVIEHMFESYTTPQTHFKGVAADDNQSLPAAFLAVPVETQDAIQLDLTRVDVASDHLDDNRVGAEVRSPMVAGPGDLPRHRLTVQSERSWAPLGRHGIPDSSLSLEVPEVHVFGPVGASGLRLSQLPLQLLLEPRRGRAARQRTETPPRPPTRPTQPRSPGSDRG